MKYSYLIGISLLSSCLCAGFAFAEDDTYLSSPALKVVEFEGALKTVEQGPTSGQQLLELLLSLNNTQANFQQTLLDFRGQVLDQSSGTLTLSKPNLRWQVNSPFTQVIVVADGLLRIYDPDLEQVIEKVMSGSDEALPLKLLLDPKQLLAGDYRINKISVDGDVQFLLQPYGNQSLFTSVRLAFMGQELTQLEITDHVGQRTLVTFSGIRSRQKISASTFELDLPANTEVLRG